MLGETAIQDRCQRKWSEPAALPTKAFLEGKIQPGATRPRGATETHRLWQKTAGFRCLCRSLLIRRAVTLGVAPLLRATALAVPGTLVTGMMPCGCVCLRRRVASSLPACTRSRARGALVFGDVGPPRRRVCRDRGPVRIGGPSVSRGAQAGGVRPLPPPATRRCRGAARPYAVVRRTRRRGDAVRGAAGPAVWGRWRAGTACACCARYSTSWSPASSSSCSLIML